jgi:hypothetical protein
MTHIKYLIHHIKGCKTDRLTTTITTVLSDFSPSSATILELYLIANIAVQF